MGKIVTAIVVVMFFVWVGSIFGAKGVFSSILLGVLIVVISTLMDKIGLAILGALFFGWIGSFFGDTGTVIGAIFGIIVGFSTDEDKINKSIKPDNTSSERVSFRGGKDNINKATSKDLFVGSEKETSTPIYPIPVPVVKQICTESPKIEINTNINFTVNKLPKELFITDKIQLTNKINFNGLEINSTELRNSLDFPYFKDENALIERFSKDKISVSDFYDNILKQYIKN